MPTDAAVVIYISKDGVNLGGFDQAGIDEGLRTGYFASDDLAWKEGMTDWKPLSSVLDKPAAQHKKSKPAKKTQRIDAPDEPNPRQATEKQIAYIKNLGGIPEMDMTIEQASAMIQRLIDDPVMKAYRQKQEDEKARDREKHYAYNLRKDIEELRADADSDPDDIKFAEDDRVRYWQSMFNEDAFECEESTELLENYGHRFKEPSEAQVKAILADLDGKFPAWEMNAISSFFGALEQRFPQLVKK